MNNKISKVNPSRFFWWLQIVQKKFDINLIERYYLNVYKNL